MSPVRDATAGELATWDERTVRPPGGHVYQSRAWAGHRARTGWQPRFLVFGDGFGVLALLRPWPIVGGASAYLPRGPIPTDDPGQTAKRLVLAASFLADAGVDVVAADPEVAAASPYLRLVRAAGFRPIEEIQASRHRMSLPLGTGANEAAVFAVFARATRQRIRGAGASGMTIVRHDAAADAGVGEGFLAPAEPAPPALERFYDLLRATGERRRFAFGPRDAYLAWWRAALAAGHLIYLEAQFEREPIAGLVLYRHGGRLSTVHSADRPETRRAHPGALHLLRWRSIQLAVREGCTEMDLGGVDLPGARRPPREGEPTFGLYQHKRSFGAEWMELAGAHEKAFRPRRYAVGRTLARISRLLGR